jgi:hypothetical protein
MIIVLYPFLFLAKYSVLLVILIVFGVSLGLLLSADFLKSVVMIMASAFDRFYCWAEIREKRIRNGHKC